MSKSIKLTNKLTNKYGAYPTGRHVVVRKMHSMSMQTKCLWKSVTLIQYSVNTLSN